MRPPACPDPRVSYQVSVYFDHGDECDLVLTEDCPDGHHARSFAHIYLMVAYVEFGFPTPGWEGLRIWCELEPGRRAGGQWQPDPRAEGKVDLVELDPYSGKITSQTDATLWCWTPAAGGERGRHA